MTDPIKLAREALDAARFLSDRLSSFELTDDADDMASEYIGHVEPAETRLRTALAALDAIPQPAADGPNAHDGCDHEGFAGGCIRAGHTPEACPARAPAPGDAELDALQRKLAYGLPGQGHLKEAADALSRIRTRLAEVEGALLAAEKAIASSTNEYEMSLLNREHFAGVVAAHRKLKEGK
jgi:hypothetical protein